MLSGCHHTVYNINAARSVLEKHIHETLPSHSLIILVYISSRMVTLAKNYLDALSSLPSQIQEYNCVCALNTWSRNARNTTSTYLRPYTLRIHSLSEPCSNTTR